MALLGAGTFTRGIWTRLAYALQLVLLSASGVCSQAINEYEIKAAYLYNFAKFVEWPAQTFRNDKDPMQICILGENPFGNMLRDTVRGKSAGGRSLVVRDIGDISEAPACQILFISASEHKRLKSILSGRRMTGVLTVGETEGFCAQAGVVNFKPENGRIVFEINLDAAAQANVRVSANVLGLAQIVRTGSKE
jgi:hypothetical protein